MAFWLHTAAQLAVLTEHILVANMAVVRRFAFVQRFALGSKANEPAT